MDVVKEDMLKVGVTEEDRSLPPSIGVVGADDLRYDVWKDCGWVLLHTSNNANVLTAICTITLKVRCRMRMESLEAENGPPQKGLAAQTMTRSHSLPKVPTQNTGTKSWVELTKALVRKHAEK